MTQEEKQLLLKDLSARLPYGVILQLSLWEEKTMDCRLTSIDEDGNLTADVPADCAFSIEMVKPYLRPISSMTEEEEIFYNIKYPYIKNYEQVDWLNVHHFDYRGLIEKGLAIEVTKENNPYEN